MNAYINLSGADLRARATTDAGAQAEIARRAAKREASGKWTVAAARSQGRQDIVAAKVAPKVAPAPAPVLTRTVPVVTKVAPKRDSLKQVRADIGARLDRIEGTLAAIAKRLG